MGKTRDLFKKIRDTNGTFHAKMGSIKDRNGMDLTEAEDIKKRWQEYTEVYKTEFNDPDNHDCVITHLESDTTKCLQFHFSLSTFTHWRRNWQPSPVFLPGGSQGRGSLVGWRLCGRTESDTTEAT